MKNRGCHYELSAQGSDSTSCSGLVHQERKPRADGRDQKSRFKFLLKYVKSIDKDAFLSVSSVTGVYGKGFDTIKNSAIKEGSKEKSRK